MTSDVLDSGGPAALRSGLLGDVIGPGDSGYDEARAVFNGMVDRRPAVIAQCADPRDVASAVAFARSHGLELSVRGGGHGVTGAAVAEGGLVVDLRRMNSIQVDPQAGTARVGGGATMADLDRATQPYGLATTGGRASTTGVGGLTLGGGSGWLERRFGLMCDNLLSADLVTADSRRVRADEQQHPELFWALHGGGGNFGVVTSFTFGLHPLPAFAIALLLWPAEAGPEVVRRYRDYLDDAPDEVGGALLYLTAPPEPFVPPDLVGRLAVGVLLTYTGGLGQAQPVFEPLLGLDHRAEVIAELPYADVQCMLDDPPGYRNYWSAEYLAGFPDQAADLFCARARDMVTPSPSQHVLFPLGGAVAAGRDDFPVPWRSAPWAVHPFGLWEDPADDARGRAWARAVCTDLRPWSVGAVYLNFIGDEGEERRRAGLGERNARRLAAVKGEYDPDNTFHLNHNIVPA
ncbi:FAD-binding oxidoreductase [Kitasatospora sp. MBT63]|uniref:FAD-binding oxidoreductase n=1 Tax=Kitasatospora sp. MBT63 TaxID=1444768 RepID=UPI0005398A78|nr:FAD-binding oxidoreductase [Kitasatospora sp. MBT63]